MNFTQLPQLQRKAFVGHLTTAHFDGHYDARMAGEVKKSPTFGFLNRLGPILLIWELESFHVMSIPLYYVFEQTVNMSFDSA